MTDALDEVIVSGGLSESVTFSSNWYVPAAVEPVVLNEHVVDVGDAQSAASVKEVAPGASSSHWYV